MKKVATLVVLLVFAASLGITQAMAADEIDESKLSPEAKALKERYDKKIEELQGQFQKEMEDLCSRMDEYEGKSGAEVAGKWYDNITINGYFQARYRHFDYDENRWPIVNNQQLRDQFYIPRLYVNFISQLNNKTKAVLTVQRGGATNASADWANVFVEYNFDDIWSARFGQAQHYFGIDMAESSSARLPMERAGFATGGAGLRGAFADAWDRGIWVTRKGCSKAEPDVILGLFNGEWRNVAADGSVGYSVDARWNFDWGFAGVSWVDSHIWDAVNGTQPREMFGLHARYLGIPRWRFQGEWVTGTVGTVGGQNQDADGWYLQAAHEIPSMPGIVFARYDEWDAGQATSDYQALHLGYRHQLTSLDELTLQLTDADLGGASANEAMFQYQRRF